MPVADSSTSGARRVRIGVLSTVGVLILRLLAATWRFRFENRQAFHKLRAARQPLIFVLWHGELLPLLWLHRKEGVVLLVSMHRDGEILARIGRALGYETVRGSSSRGGARAILELVQVMEGGRDAAITPDGPRGPRHAFAPGALAVAQRARAPILCLRARASRSWHLRSWDRFLIPKPFARIDVSYSEPQYVKTETARDAEREAPRFEQLMGSLAATPNEESP